MAKKVPLQYMKHWFLDYQIIQSIQHVLEPLKGLLCNGNTNYNFFSYQAKIYKNHEIFHCDKKLKKTSDSCVQKWFNSPKWKSNMQNLVDKATDYHQVYKSISVANS